MPQKDWDCPSFTETGHGGAAAVAVRGREAVARNGDTRGLSVTIPRNSLPLSRSSPRSGRLHACGAVVAVLAALREPHHLAASAGSHVPDEALGAEWAGSET
ncbi:hypothetical protein GCM10023080_025230 [Streptomyces pseudoechinosporeus]